MEFFYLRTSACRIIFLFSIVLLVGAESVYAQTLRAAVAGLTHDHAYGLMGQYQRGEVQLAGIAEADTSLVNRYKARYHLPDSIFYPSLAALLKKVKPDIVLAYNAIADHLSVVEQCAPLKIPVMVEKPLATTVADAKRIQALSQQYGIPVLTNFETTWYASNEELYRRVKEQRLAGSVRKMIVHTGHQGPVEIGCSKYFLSWLTDPVKNGGGAVMDFGCYGANVMTWLMDGQRPVSVMATTRTLKPAVYPKVDDDATIILEYANGATGIIQASWNWPFGIKDWEVFGEKAYLHALNGNDLQQRDTGSYHSIVIPAVRYKDNLAYLKDYFTGKAMEKNDRTALANNLIVVEILEAAKLSAKENRKILLR